MQSEFKQQLALAVDGGLAELPQTRWDWPYSIASPFLAAYCEQVWIQLRQQFL